MSDQKISLSERDVERLAETAFWREQEAGHAERDRGGYFYKGFLAGFAAATERDAAIRAEAKAEAWDEGMHDAIHAREGGEPLPSNPYRRLLDGGDQS